VGGEWDILAGLAQMRQGIAVVWATLAALWRPFGLVLLAETAGRLGAVKAGLHLLAEALEALETNAQGDMRAEAYRLQGELLLRQPAPDAAQVVRRGRGKVTVIDAVGAQIGIPPAYFDLTRLAQALVDAQRPCLWYTPGMHAFAAHAVPEVLLPLQHQHPCPVSGHSQG
jgi:hypothetical protein